MRKYLKIYTDVCSMSVDMHGNIYLWRLPLLEEGWISKVDDNIVETTFIESKTILNFRPKFFFKCFQPTSEERNLIFVLASLKVFSSIVSPPQNGAGPQGGQKGGEWQCSKKSIAKARQGRTLPRKGCIAKSPKSARKRLQGK